MAAVRQGLEGVAAVVLTYRRERLATEVVRGLVDREGFDPAAVILVVNGEGGLEDARLEAAVRVLRLPRNLGPAGGFRAGLEAAAEAGAAWAYLCEDDVGLFDLPSPRVARVVAAVEARPDAAAVGGVVAYGRRMDPRTGRTAPHLPVASAPFEETDVAAWGASLVRCDVARRGVLPDGDLFFGFEDFDFWLAMRRAGYRLLLDTATAAAVADRVFHAQRDASLRARRPTDAEEPWRKYYEGRNFMELRRRHGRWTWTASHVLRTARRAQLAPTWAHRRAAIHGLWDGLRGRFGAHPRYQRGTGERPGASAASAAEGSQARPGELGAPAASGPQEAPLADGKPAASPAAAEHESALGTVLQVITDNDRRGGQVFAADLHAALARRGVTVRTVALAPASSAAGLHFDVLGASRRHVATLWRLRREIRRAGVVVGHGSTTLPACAIAGAGLRTPFVYRQISDQLFWAGTPPRAARVRLALRRADHVVALWSGAAEVLTGHFGVPGERVSVVPNGVPAERCPPADDAARKAARQRFGIDTDRPTLLSIGALVPEKGVDTVVRAMGEARAADWQLLVVGAGPEGHRLRRLAGLVAGRVAFAEPVASGAEAMAAADVVVLTSRGGDSMPAVLIEAGLMGLPVVATPVQGIVEIVSAGETGELVAIDDPPATAAAVARCLERADAYGAQARTWCAERFEIDAVAARWHEVLDRVTQGR